MTIRSRLQRAHDLVRAEWRHLTTFNPSTRRWHMAFSAALASGLPLMVGAWFGHLEYGLISSIGGLAFLYLPSTPMSHRMVWLMACAFGVAASYALGLMTHFLPLARVGVLALIAILVTMVCRFYRVGPPGSLFFVMAAAIGAYTPGTIEEIPLRVGLLTMGALLASLIAFVYSLQVLRLQPADPAPPLQAPTFDFVVFDAVVIGAFVGLALAIAQALQLDRPYWVPVSCLAVIQGVSLRAVWNRQFQRVLGTAFGMLLAWWLLSLPLDPWRIALLVIVLVFVIESLVVRHYGLAVIFITPLTILLAEAATLGHAPLAELIESRFIDTVLGCVVGLVGGICLHSPRFRDVLGGALRRRVPRRPSR
jgi:uncharacterized membrane protein YccC